MMSCKVWVATTAAYLMFSALETIIKERTHMETRPQIVIEKTKRIIC